MFQVASFNFMNLLSPHAAGFCMNFLNGIFPIAKGGGDGYPKKNAQPGCGRLGVLNCA